MNNGETRPAGTGRIENKSAQGNVMTNPSIPRRLKPGSKKYHVLLALTKRPYHRFQAEPALHDHCLHSTVAEIQRLGIRVDREMITVPGYEGHPTRVCRYWIAADQRPLALRLLGMGDA